MKYKFYSNKLRIYVDDISINKFKYSLDALQKNQPGLRIWYTRSKNSIIHEFVTKIWLNKLFHKSQSFCIDLKFKQNWFKRLFYFIFGSIICINN